MTAAPRNSSALRALLGIAAAVIVIAGSKAFSEILSPALVAIVFAILFAPILGWLQRKGLSKGISLLVLTAGIIFCGIALMLFFASSAVRLADSISGYEGGLQSAAEQIRTTLVDLGFLAPDTTLDEALVGLFTDSFDVIISALLNISSSLIFIVILVVFLLIDSSLFMSKLKRGMGADNPLVARFSQFSHQVVSYVAIRVRVNLITGSAFAAMLLVLGIDFAVLWGVLAFFLSFIPYLGLTLATIPPLLLAIAEYGIGRGLLVIAGMLLINFTAENAVAPAMMGQGLNLSPFVVFFAFFFWGWLLGPLGLFLAMPVTMFLLMILDSYEDTRWIAVLMSNSSGQARPGDEDRQIGEATV